jgi:hypothetical protein
MAKKQFRTQKEIGTRLKKKNILNNLKSFTKNNIKIDEWQEKVDVNGIKISKKLLNRESLKCCPVCGFSQRNLWMMFVLSSLIVAINVTFNMSKAEKKDG